jgi:pyruvate dehydrogenase E1 component
LGGEGLQHQDGSSHLVAATIPNCKAYDPAFAGELAVILDAGMREMVEQQADVFYYITLMNENYAQPNLPEDAARCVLRGGYHFGAYGPASGPANGPASGQRVTLLGSGAILTEVIQAAEQLAAQGVGVDVYSITSWSELARDGMANEASGDTPYLSRLLAPSAGPIVAASDYVRAVPESVRAYLPEGRRYSTLGTDGFGRSDTRAALRRFFAVDAGSIAQAALKSLGR